MGVRVPFCSGSRSKSRVGRGRLLHVTGRLRCSCALACLLLVTSVQTIALPVQLLPVDEASRQPDFFSFRAQLQTSLARHNADAVMAILDPNIKLSFGGDDGIENFRRMWRPTYSDSELWAELGAVLALGGTFSSESSFTAPYVFSKWPDRFDGFEHVALIAANVRIRSAPQADASTVASLSFAILPVARANGIVEADGWTAVQLDGKQTGYVASHFVRSPISYRAMFNKTNGRWLMTLFLAGD